MIPEVKIAPKYTSWQRALQNAYTTPAELLEFLGIDPRTIRGGVDLNNPFPLRIPEGFARRMRPGDPDDPLLLQVLPSLQERLLETGYVQDPLDEDSASPIPGLLHKYHGRALIVTTGACAVHCRYCFRRHFPYQQANARADNWTAIRRYLAADDSISEVLLSGGDPLALSDERLRALCEAVAEIPHIRRLRIHTRFPIVLPERIDADFSAWLAVLPLQSVVVVHANHPRELDSEVGVAIERLRGAGITLLNQAVLLRRVNDNVQTLRDLSVRLFEYGIMPYYLHLLDRVQGAGHFDVDATTAARLLESLRAELPGYLVPRLVKEVAGAASKLPI